MIGEGGFVRLELAEFRNYVSELWVVGEELSH